MIAASMQCDKTIVTNDPLGQAHSSGQQWFSLDYESLWRTDVYVGTDKIVITFGWNTGLA